MVSQTSENWAPGSKLVTSIGSAIGTLELRRNVGTFVLCIASALSRGLGATRPANGRSAAYKYVNPKLLRRANPVVPFQDVRWDNVFRNQQMQLQIGQTGAFERAGKIASAH
jgi:hypothetical protein